MLRTALLSATILAAGLCAPVATGQSAQSYDSNALSIENFIGRVEVREAQGNTISVSVQGASEAHPGPSISQSGNRVEVDGGQSLRGMNCNSRNNVVRVGRRMGQQTDITEYPVLIIEAPATLALSIDDSIFVGEAGNLGSADISIDSCGDFQLGNVAGNADISINGSGDLSIGSVGGDADFSINGSGDIGAASVADLDVSINGSGDIEIDRHSGSFDTSINGSGVVMVSAGMATRFEVSINGSGDIDYRGEAGDVEISNNGSGDIALAAVGNFRADLRGSGDIDIGTQTGHFEVDSNGSGDVRVDRGRAMPFIVEVSGSGDVRHGGEAVNTDVEIDGSGDVSADSYSGEYRWQSRNGRVRHEAPAGG